jgi:1-acyl-sn-glycerol-3-phosphate acyltransferase
MTSESAKPIAARGWRNSLEVAGLPGARPFGQRVFYRLSRAASYCLLRLFCRLRITGAEKVPASGAAILASNHQSFLDPVVVGCGLTRHCHYLARESLFKVPLLRSVILRLNAMPVARESVAPKQALEVCLKALESGRLLVFFPEGTRTRDGELGPLKRGIALMARRSGVPVVPVWIEGSFQAWPRHRRLPRPAPIEVRFGNALFYDDKQESADAFVDRLRAAMADLGRECRESILRREAK